MTDLKKHIETLAEEADRYIKAPGSTINPNAQTQLSPGAEGSTAGTPLPSISLRGTEFEPIKLLGEGGMGRVDLMKQRSLRREVAVKSVKASRSSPQSSEALLKEAIFTGTLEHPNIVPVHIVAINEEGNPVLVMKRIEGLSLRELLRQPTHALWGGADRTARVVEILMQVCNAVYFAHKRGILHRDIKPENIMVGFFGEVYLVDWGVAIMLSEAEHIRGLAGTPSYMAPESVNGAKLCAQTDIYLLGGCLYEALTGQPPHSGESIRNVLLAASEGRYAPLPEGTPRELAMICERALQHKPEERFESAEQLREALGRFLQHQGSVRLTREALALFQGAHGADERRLLVESRFGLQQALREWPENPQALEGIERCTAQLFLLEIQEQNVSAATLLLRELKRPTTEHQLALEALIRRRQEADDAARRLAAIEQEQDLKISNTARLRLAILVVSLDLLVTAYLALQIYQGSPPISVERSLAIILVILAIASLIFFFGRRFFFTNKINRQLATSLLMLIVCHGIHRLMSLWIERPIEQMFLEEVFFFGVAFIVLGVFYRPYLFAAGALSLLLAVVSSWYPGYASVLLGLQLGAPFVGMIIEWGRIERQRHPKTPSP